LRIYGEEIERKVFGERGRGLLRRYQLEELWGTSTYLHTRKDYGKKARRGGGGGEPEK